MWGFAREDTEIRINLADAPEQNPNPNPGLGGIANLVNGGGPGPLPGGGDGGIQSVLGSVTDVVGGNIGNILLGTIVGGLVGGTLVGGFAGKKKRKKRSAEDSSSRQPKMLFDKPSLNWRDITDGVMTDFLAMAEIRYIHLTHLPFFLHKETNY